MLRPTQTEQSKLFPNEAFGYWKVTVDRPLRLAVNLSEERLTAFDKLCATEKEETLCAIVRRVGCQMGTGPHMDSGTFFAACESDADAHGKKFTAKRKKLLQSSLCDINEKAAPVVKKVHKKAEPKPLHGLYAVTLNAKKCVVEYEPDTALRDSEQIPLLEEGSIDAFFHREVLPYTPDAWIDAEKTQKGYEISFTRHFYKPAPMRTLEEIRANILALEQETDGPLGQIMENV